MQSVSGQILATKSGTVYGSTGSHFLLSLAGCPAELLDDEEKLRQVVEEAARATGATVLQVVSRQFQPHGVTALAMLAESHASLHTYPESQKVFWDCFTCGSECRPELSGDVLIRALKPMSIKSEVVARQ